MTQRIMKCAAAIAIMVCFTIQHAMAADSPLRLKAGDGVTIDSDGFYTQEGNEYFTSGSEVTLSFNFDQNNEQLRLSFCGYTITGEGNTLTALNDDYTQFRVTLQSDATIELLFQGSGTESDPYLVTNLFTWTKLHTIVATGNSCMNLHFLQTADISGATEGLGTSYYPFSGYYDGGGHTLNVNMTGWSPFYRISAAHISNLHITGTVKGNGDDHVGGLVGKSEDDENFVNYITNCRVSAEITALVKEGQENDDRQELYAGGFIGNAARASNHLTGCLFDGIITHNGKVFTLDYSQNNAYEDMAHSNKLYRQYAAAFIGWCDRNKSENQQLRDCVERGTYSKFCFTGPNFQRADVDGEFGMSYLMCNDGSLYCWSQWQLFSFQETVGVLNETVYRNIKSSNSALKPVFTGNANTYDVCGLTFYSSGFAYGGKLYSDKGKNVSLRLADYTYTLNSCTATASDNTAIAVTTNTSNGQVSFTMPDKDVTIAASLTRQYTVTIGNVNNGTVTVSNTKPTVGEKVTVTTTAADDLCTLRTFTITNSEGNTIGYSTTDHKIYSFDMPASDVVVTARFSAWDEGDGSKENPYRINNTDDMNRIATYVNNDQTKHFAGEYFLLTTDLDYSGKTFTPVGAISGVLYYFGGIFDGGGHTISGLQVEIDMRASVFATVDGDAVIKNLTVANSTFKNTLYDVGGGIAGRMMSGTILNCHVTADVIVDGGSKSKNYFGGIVGYNIGGTVSGCTSAATVSGNKYVGGIVGLCGTTEQRKANAVVEDCLYYGTTLNCNTNEVGAISGQTSLNTNYNTVSYRNNYYVTNAGVKGVCHEDITSDHGAVEAWPYDSPTAIGYLQKNYQTEHGSTAVIAYSDGIVYGGKYYSHALHLADQGRNTDLIDTNKGRTLDITLTGRTLWKDGYWNTLSLPFDMTSSQISNSPLKDATIKQFNAANSGFSEGTLTLNFNTVDAITAGIPCLVKWENSNTTITEPIFNDVTVSASASTEGETSTDGYVTFRPCFDQQIFNVEDPTLLYLGADNTLYYPNGTGDGVTLGAFRAYFQLNNGLSVGDDEGGAGGSADVREMRLTFDDDATAITQLSTPNSQLSTPDSQLSTHWYTLDGRQLTGKPQSRGIYLLRTADGTRTVYWPMK